MRMQAKAAVAGALLPATAVAVALLVAGCGGSDSPPAEARVTGTEESTSTSLGEKGDGAGASSKRESLTPAEERERAKAEARKDGPKPGKHGPGVAQPKGEPEPGITPKQRAHATTADMTLTSRAFGSGAVVPARYTCDGKDESPPLSWKGVPSDAGELVLFALNLRPVNESLFFDWAVAGMDPSSTSIEEGHLPAGAVVGRNSFGKPDYSLCPPSGDRENYIFMLYAIPEALHPKPGFDPLSVREAVVVQAGNVGLLAASYGRQ